MLQVILAPANKRLQQRNVSCLWYRCGFWVAVEFGDVAAHKGVAGMRLHGRQQSAIVTHTHVPVVQCFLNRLPKSLKTGEIV